MVSGESCIIGPDKLVYRFRKYLEDTEVYQGVVCEGVLNGSVKFDELRLTVNLEESKKLIKEFAVAQVADPEFDIAVLLER